VHAAALTLGQWASIFTIVAAAIGLLALAAAAAALWHARRAGVAARETVELSRLVRREERWAAYARALAEAFDVVDELNIADARHGQMIGVYPERSPEMLEANAIATKLEHETDAVLFRLRTAMVGVPGLTVEQRRAVGWSRRAEVLQAALKEAQDEVNRLAELPR
jgi:hypothetical protein